MKSDNPPLQVNGVPFRYADGSLICVGDTVEVVSSVEYAGGGRHDHHYIGVVQNDGQYGQVLMQVKKWIYHYGCSQRFGTETPNEFETVQFEHDTFRTDSYLPTAGTTFKRLNE